MGFAARRVVPLESSHVTSLVEKFADRRRLSATKAAQLAAQVARREYRGLAEVRVGHSGPCHCGPEGSGREARIAS